MKTTSKKVLVGVGMLALASAALFSSTASAASATPTQRFHRQHTSQTHQAVEAAIKANDYNAFIQATANAPKPTDAPEITPAVFAKLVEAQKLRDTGDTKGAETIMQSIGFKVPMGPHGQMAPPNLTDAQKAALDQARTLHESGKDEEAQAVLKAAGITLPQHHQHQTTQ